MSRSRHWIFVNLRKLADIQILLECRWHNIRSNTLKTFVKYREAVIVSLSQLTVKNAVAPRTKV